MGLIFKNAKRVQEINIQEDFQNNNLIFSNVEEILGNSGRIFVRKSGTQSLIRVLIEHESNEVLELAEQKIKLIR